MLPPFQQIVDEHWHEVARLTAALAAPGDAEDAARRAWLAALRAYPTVRRGRDIRGWLLAIAARAAIDGHRAGWHRVGPGQPSASGPAPGRAGDDALWGRVRELPERQRTAVALRYVLDLPHVDIAQLLGTTEAVARRLVGDALATLRKEIER